MKVNVLISSYNSKLVLKVNVFYYLSLLSLNSLLTLYFQVNDWISFQSRQASLHLIASIAFASFLNFSSPLFLKKLFFFLIIFLFIISFCRFLSLNSTRPLPRNKRLLSFFFLLLFQGGDSAGCFVRGLVNLHRAREFPPIGPFAVCC